MRFTRKAEDRFRKVFIVVPLTFAAAAIAALVFVNISGTTNSTLLNNFYFSELQHTYRWTLYGLCVKNADNTFSCPAAKPAYPYSPVDNLAGNGIPSEFHLHRDAYYHLLRTGYVFFLLSLLFSALTLILILVPNCANGSRGSYPATTVLFMAFIFSSTASLMETIVHVGGVNAFKHAGIQAELGKDMFICMWLGSILLLLTFMGLAVVSRLEQRRVVYPQVMLLSQARRSAYYGDSINSSKVSRSSITPV